MGIPSTSARAWPSKSTQRRSPPVGSWMIVVGVVVLVIATIGAGTILASRSNGDQAATVPTHAASATSTAAPVAPVAIGTRSPGSASTSPPALSATSAPEPTTAPTETSAPTPTPVPTASNAKPTSTIATSVSVETACPDQAQLLQTLASLPGIARGTILCGNSEIARAGDQAAPSASVIKLAIAAEAYHQMSTGALNPSQLISVRQADVVGGTGVLQSQVGNQFTIDQIVRLMLLYSDNTAGNILIDRLGGFSPINAYAAQLGLHNTQLKRKFLDTRAEAAGVENLTSSNDVAFFLLKLSRGQVVNSTYSSLMLQILRERATTDRNWLLANMPAGVTAAHITGILSGVRNDAILVETPRGSYVLVVLVQNANEAAAEQAIRQAGDQVYRMMIAE
ncbi:MAG TPA: serine hydrolase [Chloroflexota bacterium]|nr:serine hydrolase [Chloroflexota bacterium]